MYSSMSVCNGGREIHNSGAKSTNNGRCINPAFDIYVYFDIVTYYNLMSGITCRLKVNRLDGAAADVSAYGFHPEKAVGGFTVLFNSFILEKTYELLYLFYRPYKLAGL